MKREQIIKLVAALGLFQVAVHYLIASLVNGPGPLAIAQPDTLLYCQATKRIAEGAAFSFSAGSAASSGTTSIMYPFSLLVPYLFGFAGDRLIAAGFVLNACFYLVAVVSWSMVFCRWSVTSRSACMASVLLVLCPSMAYSVLAQSDAGMWVALTSAFVAALSFSKTWLYCALIIMAPWVRPEGLVLSIALLAGAIVQRRQRDVWIAAAGVASSIAVLAFNFWMTGCVGFSSVANKGYISLMSFPSACVATLSDFITLIREVILCQATDLPRKLYSVPFVGGIAVVVGLVGRSWEFRTRHNALLVMAAACVGGLLMVAASGWQGTNMDRYLIWLVPVFVYLGATGYDLLHEHFKTGGSRALFVVTPIVFAAMSAIGSAFAFGDRCRNADQMCKFAREANGLMPTHSSVGLWGCAGLFYFWGDRHCAHLSGIYSPEYASREKSNVIELLKYKPELRFDHWLLNLQDEYYDSCKSVAGELCLGGPDDWGLFEARWSAFDEAARPPVCGERRLVSRVDVGYVEDEDRSCYQVITRHGQEQLHPFVCSARRDKSLLIDVGRVIIGMDRMTVRGLTPGQDLWVVVRTCRKATARSMPNLMLVSREKEYEFGDEVEMHASVDGQEVSCCHLRNEKDGLADIAVMIPGSSISNEDHVIGFNGDHIAFGYWFYQ